MEQGIDNVQVTGNNSKRREMSAMRVTLMQTQMGNARDQLLTSRVSPLVYVVRFVQALIPRKQLELFLTTDMVSRQLFMLYGTASKCRKMLTSPKAPSTYLL